MSFERYRLCVCSPRPLEDVLRELNLSERQIRWIVERAASKEIHKTAHSINLHCLDHPSTNKGAYAYKTFKNMLSASDDSLN